MVHILKRSLFLDQNSINVSDADASHLPNETTTLLIVSFAVFAAIYSFSVYSFYAPNMRSLFFANATGSEWIATLQTATVIAVGFISRPLGALVLGQYGDIKGRKPMMHIAMILLFVTTLLSACLPTYAHVGSLAPILLFVIRLIQGMMFGALFSLGWVYIAESLVYKHLTMYVSVFTAIAVAGVFTAAITHLFLVYSLTPVQMAAFGWRVAFLIGTVISGIGIYATKKLAETPLFLEYKEKTLTDTKSAFYHFQALLLTALLCFTFSSVMVLTISLLPDLIELKFSFANASMQLANLSGIVALAIGMVFYGWLADRIGKGMTLMIGAMLLATHTLLFYNHLMSSSGDYLVVMYTLFGFFGGVISLCPIIFLHLFPLKHRLVTIGLIFNVMTVFAGAIFRFGLLQATSLFSFAPAFYVLFLCFCAFAVGFFVYQSPRWRKLERVSYSK